MRVEGMGGRGRVRGEGMGGEDRVGVERGEGVLDRVRVEGRTGGGGGRAGGGRGCGGSGGDFPPGELVKIADKLCPDEVAAFHRCKAQHPGSDCEELDLAALQCAGRRVLESARAPPSGSSRN